MFYELHHFYFFDTVGTVLHEMLHAMGFVHEHQRSDRDDFVKVNYQNIHPGMCDYIITISIKYICYKSFVSNHTLSDIFSVRKISHFSQSLKPSCYLSQNESKRRC